MVTALHEDARPAPSKTWSLYAGLYLVGCGVVLAVLLNDMLTLLGDVIGLPTPYSSVIFPSPALLFGALSWWLVVERRAAYAYRFGAVVGLLTALLTGVVWTARFVVVWGVEMLTVPMVAVLVGFVLGFAVLAGVLSGPPLMYARRRLNRRATDRRARGGRH